MPLPSGTDLVLIHNPRCSKSRAAKALLEERGVGFQTRAYLDEPLSRAELDERLVGRSKIDPRTASPTTAPLSNANRPIATETLTDSHAGDDQNGA